MASFAQGNIDKPQFKGQYSSVQTKYNKGTLLIIIVGYSDSIVKNFVFFFQRHKLENLKQMLTWSICFRI